MLNFTNHQANKIKNKMRYHLTSVKQKMLSRGKNEEKEVPLNAVGENVNWYTHYGKEYGAS